MADGKVTIDTSLNNKGFEAGLKTVTGKLGGLGKTVGKLSLAIVAAFGAAAVAITKQSVDAYADWEQLMGGVETLFKGAADKVKQYAEDAFFSAGMSANEYMETVTGVSASLISSLGGDTAKAADIADMAIRDMADNANKMGTPLENVKTAYAGFAKQQYMLLDNLKLGYGGTKTEMQRLLKDAEAFSGVEYDINNLGDVYSAIHAIQEKLGITGATAAEAEKTITGSANMTKAAWKNVLTAIAGGGDLDKAINNLVYSVSKYFENIVPVVQRSISGIGQLIEKVAPQLVQTVASSLIAAIPSLLNAIYQMIIGLAKGIYQGIIALFSGGSFSGTITKQLNNVSSGFSGAASGAEDLAEETEKAGKAAKKSLAGFDELNVLADKSGGAAGAGSVGGGGSAGSTTATVTVEGTVSDSVSPALQVIFDKVKQLIEPLRNIDFSPAAKAFKKLGDSIKNLGKTIGTNLEWFWFNILVPLSEFAIEDVLPKYFEMLAGALEVLDSVLGGAMDLFRQFVDDFLKPIAEHQGQKLISFLEDMSGKIENLATMLEESQIWQDLQVILGVLYEALEPVVTYLSDIQWAFANFYLNNAWEEAKKLFKDLEDAIGVVAALIEGDFNDAWEHLKDLMWENKIDKAKENADNLKTSIENLITTASDFAEKWKESIESVVEEWKKKISAWWTEDVEPWFTVEKWEETIQGMVDGFANCWNNVYDFFALEVPKWWDEDIAPWFTKEKWEDLIATAVEGVTSKWEDFKKFFSETLPLWWQDNVEPWFTKEKWEELGEKAIKGLANAIIDGMNKLISGLNKFSIEIPQIKGVTEGFTFGLNIPKIPKLAQGAVLPANKPFLAMVGDQRHGTNIEAPLSTIQEAVALVMQDYAASNLAGHEATVAVLREILEAVMGISIGDDVIANAVGRYQSRMAVVRGGQL